MLSATVAYRRKKKNDKHGGDEPDIKLDKAAENKECNEKEREKVRV